MAKKSAENFVANQSMGERILDIMRENSSHGKETIFRIRESCGEVFLCKIELVGNDFIEILDNDGRRLIVSLFGVDVRDVTNVDTFVFKGGK